MSDKDTEDGVEIPLVNEQILDSDDKRPHTRKRWPLSPGDMVSTRREENEDLASHA
jgi:hypothetical protein